MHDECNDNVRVVAGGIGKEGILLTQAGSLRARHVLHLNVNTLNDNGTWKEGIKKVLQGVENLQLQSVTFPALGTGSYTLKLTVCHLPSTWNR